MACSLIVCIVSKELKGSMTELSASSSSGTYTSSPGCGAIGA